MKDAGIQMRNSKLLALFFLAALTTFAPVSAANGSAALWRDPGAVEALDLAGGPGGAADKPEPPFRFVDEVMTGTTPKLRVDDAKGVRWMVKFGKEVKPQTFATRIAWAVGYCALPVYFVGDGAVTGVTALKRAAKHVRADGRFSDASFARYLDSSVKWLTDTHSWSWNENPFLGTPQLNGLKVLLMLLSDWDNKDARDIEYGSNTAILIYPNGETQYIISDWGATLGTWGNYVTRSKWNCAGFEAQSDHFVGQARSGELRWGYAAHDTTEFTNDIRVGDVHWLLTYLGRITDSQLNAGLIASGATPEEARCFTGALRRRIEALQALR
jgi:hypothetical protein